MTEPARERRRVEYAGRVQGVGFRYRVVQVARAYAVTGYVRNLPAGTVELVGDAFPEILDRFLKAVGDELSGYIEHQAVTRVPRDEVWTTFSIRY